MSRPARPWHARADAQRAAGPPGPGHAYPGASPRTRPHTPRDRAHPRPSYQSFVCHKPRSRPGAAVASLLNNPVSEPFASSAVPLASHRHPRTLLLARRPLRLAYGHSPGLLTQCACLSRAGDRGGHCPHQLTQTWPGVSSLCSSWRLFVRVPWVLQPQARPAQNPQTRHLPLAPAQLLAQRLAQRRHRLPRPQPASAPPQAPAARVRP